MKKTYTYEEALAASIEYFKGDELAAKVFLDKYALRNADQFLVESTPEQMHRRIAKEFARVEKKKFKNPLSEEQIFNYLDGFAKIVPQGSPMFGIGNDSQFISLSNCFVVESPADSYAGICKIDEELVQISKRRGGVGVDISNLRPEGSITRNAARTSTGIISFMERFSNSIREVGQNGRRGAEMQSISIHHPEAVKILEEGETPEKVVVKNETGDIHTTTEHYNPKRLDFATVKYDNKRVTGANISIRFTDEFLNAVDNDTDFEQRWPVDSKTPVISKHVNARKVWHKIVQSAWQMAEPGILFWDNIIKESPADCYVGLGFKTISTNPCVTKDTWVMTSTGAKKVIDLIGKKFHAVVNGRCYETESNGFFLTGIKRIKKVTTNRGHTLRVTDNHKIMTPDGWKELKELSIGSQICISNHRKFNWEGIGNRESGYLVGSLLGDGTFTEGSAKLTYWGQNKFAMLQHSAGMLSQSGLGYRADAGSASDSVNSEIYDRVSMKSVELSRFAKQVGVTESKILEENIEKTSSDFYMGFLSGWFDADGTVGLDEAKGSFCVRLSSSVLSNLETAQRMLARVGVQSSIYANRRNAGFRMLPDGNGGLSEYWCDAQHELHIGKDNIVEFNDLVGFSDPEKKEKLTNLIDGYVRGPYQEDFVTTISSITDDGEEDVYDCTVEKVHEFDANGIRVHNCGEIPLSAYDSCRLLLLNLFGFVKNPFTPHASFDYIEFFEVAKIAQRLMDDLIDLEEEAILGIIAKIEADPELTEIKSRELGLWNNILLACRKGRRTGTGITALGDTLAALGIAYASEDGIATTEKLYKVLKHAAYTASVEMAKELGPFPIWDYKLEKDNPFLNRIKEEKFTIDDGDREFNGTRELDGEALWNDMKKYGRRNIALLTTAPAGSVSLQTQTSSGIEPQFMIDPYTRRKKGNPGDKNFRSDFVDQNGDHWMEFEVYPPKVALWREVTGETDLNKSPWRGSCAGEIDWKLRVRLQAAAQRHVDHSISSTLNLPNDVSVEKVDEIYRTAWKAGCKGVTIYRDGCRTGVMVKKEEKKVAEDKIQKTNAPKRPNDLPCDVYHIKAKGEEWFVIVGLMGADKDPYECFAGKNGMIAKEIKHGTLRRVSKGKYDAIFDNGETLKNVTDHISDDEEALTRMVSTSLRHGADIQFIVDQLEKTKGSLLAFSKAVARALKKYIKDGVSTKEICGQDGCEGVLRRQDGCLSCPNCGYSKCN